MTLVLLTRTIPNSSIYYNYRKTSNIATEFAEIVEIAMVFLKIAKIAVSQKHSPARA